MTPFAAPDAPPPHRIQPALTDMTAADFDAFRQVTDRAFHERTEPEVAEAESALIEPGRFFGFAAGSRVVSTFGSFPRQLTVPGGETGATSAITAVTVHSAFRRRGLLRTMMTRELQSARSRGESIAALYASEAAIYGRFGFGNAAPAVTLTGAVGRLTPRADVAERLAAAGGSVDEVDRDTYLRLAAPVQERLRSCRPGSFDRSRHWWRLKVIDPPERRKNGAGLRFVVSYADDGTVDGYAMYRVKASWSSAQSSATAYIEEIDAGSPVAWARLWRYVTRVDLVDEMVVERLAPDNPLQHLVTDPRALEMRLNDALYIRLLDVERALSLRRYAAPVDAVIRLHDESMPENAGCYALAADRDGAQVARTDREADITLDVRDLAAVYLGGVSLGALHAAGLVDEHRPGAVAGASAAFGWPIAPFCADFF